MKIKKTFSVVNIILLLTLVTINGCLVDIPITRADGPTHNVYGKVVNSETGDPVEGAVIPCIVPITDVRRSPFA